MYCRGDQPRSFPELNSMLNDVDRMDIFQVLVLLDIYHVRNIKRDDVVQLRLHLKRVLILEILKINSELAHVYRPLLEIITDNLRVSFKAYECCYSGCRFDCGRHKEYIRHLKLTHYRASDIPCKFHHTCARRLNSIEDLLVHIKNDHSVDNGSRYAGRTVSLLDNPVKCNMTSCGSRHFKSVRELATHMNTFHGKEVRTCIFKDCDTKFSQNQESRRHFRLKHFDKGHAIVKNAHVISRIGDTPESSIDFIDSSPPDGESYTVHDIDQDDANYYNTEEMEEFDSSSNIQGENEEYFKFYYADFLNRLAHFKFIPHATVQDIAEEYFQSIRQSLKSREQTLRHSLSKNTNISQDEIDQIVDDVQKDDYFLRVQAELNTDYKRNRFIQSNFSYVAPVELILNKTDVEKGLPKDVVHYVPIGSALRILLQDKSFIQMMARFNSEMRDTDLKITDIKDGSNYKSKDFFIQNHGALSLLFYSDAIELKNPLGSAKGSYKVVQVFYTLADIPKSQRSQVDRLQLVMVFREKLLKKYSQNIIFSRLVKDLKELQVGIRVFTPNESTVKIGLLLHSADNLEAHQIGGFSGSFSSKSICRFCHCQYEDLDHHIHDYDSDEAHSRWSITEYDMITETFMEETFDDCELSGTLGTDEDEEDVDLDLSSDDQEGNDLEQERWGVKSKCPFNVLEPFHCVTSLPPDLMHDLFEGVVAEDLYSVIKTLSVMGWFQLEQYNSKLCNFGWISYEERDKPEKLPTASKSKKLKGKAISLWTHLRNFPLIIESFITDREDLVLNLGLRLHEVCERCTAHEFFSYEIDLLDESIVAYLDHRKQVRGMWPDIFGRPKPKHHFLT